MRNGESNGKAEKISSANQKSCFGNPQVLEIPNRKSVRTGNSDPEIHTETSAPTRTATARPSLRHSRESGNPVPCLQPNGLPIQFKGCGATRRSVRPGFPLSRE
jgi:hypothetical protein